MTFTTRVWFDQAGTEDYVFGCWWYEVTDASGTTWDIGAWDTEEAARHYAGASLALAEQMAREGAAHPLDDVLDLGAECLPPQHLNELPF